MIENLLLPTLYETYPTLQYAEKQYIWEVIVHNYENKKTELKAHDRTIVTLVKNNENRLVITGDYKDEVEVDNDRDCSK
jgi:hypothetical protein